MTILYLYEQLISLPRPCNFKEADMFYKCNAFARWYTAKALDVCKLAGFQVDAEALTHFVLSKVLLYLHNQRPDVALYQKSLGFEIPPDVFIKGTRPAGPYFLTMQATRRGKQKPKYTFTILRLGSYLPSCVFTIPAPENIRPWLEAGLYNLIERRAYEQVSATH